MKRLSNFFSPSNLLQGIVFTLALVIPLYPKIPLFDVAFTWTYIRLEDVLVAFSFALFTVLLVFRRASLKNGLFWPIVIFWIVGFISTVWALLTLGKADNWAIFKPHLIVFHYLRRIEYLGVFFISYSAMVHAGWSGVRKYIGVLGASLAGVIVYGIGQKFFGFPAFLTMNEEFAKGVGIALQPGTRLASTFGGHYDLAGYLVFVLPIILSLVWYTHRLLYRVILLGVSLAGFYILLLTSSRISFLAIFVALGVLAFLIMKHKKYAILGLLGLILITFVFGRGTILERLEKTIRIRHVVVERSTGKVLEIPTVSKDWGGLPESDRVVLLPFVSGIATDSAYKVTKYEKGQRNPLEEGDALEQRTVEVPQSDTKEVMHSEKKEIIEEVRVVKGDFEKRLALIFDISFTTRIDGSWPKTLDAFVRHPLVGQGYSTVTAAVDSSFVRALGEVGLLGFISFFGIFVVYLRKAYAFIVHTHNYFAKLVVAGITSGTVGLLVNGLLIDIFEASKVAFVLWLTLGVALWIIEHSEDRSEKQSI